MMKSGGYMDKTLTLTSNIEQGLLIIKTNGYINNQGGEKIALEANKYMSEGIKNVLLDLGESKAINSIGISILLEILEEIEEVDGKLFVTNLDPSVEKTFNLMGLFQYADKVDSVEEAINLSS